MTDVGWITTPKASSILLGCLNVLTLISDETLYLEAILDVMFANAMEGTPHIQDWGGNFFYLRLLWFSSGLAARTLGSGVGAGTSRFLVFFGSALVDEDSQGMRRPSLACTHFYVSAHNS